MIKTDGKGKYRKETKWFKKILIDFSLFKIANSLLVDNINKGTSERGLYPVMGRLQALPRSETFTSWH